MAVFAFSGEAPSVPGVSGIPRLMDLKLTAPEFMMRPLADMGRGSIALRPRFRSHSVGCQTSPSRPEPVSLFESSPPLVNILEHAAPEGIDPLLACSMFNLIIRALEWRKTLPINDVRAKANEEFVHVHPDWRSVVINAIEHASSSTSSDVDRSAANLESELDMWLVENAQRRMSESDVVDLYSDLPDLVG